MHEEKQRCIAIAPWNWICGTLSVNLYWIIHLQKTTGYDLNFQLKYEIATTVIPEFVNKLQVTMSDVFTMAEACSPLVQSCVSESPVGTNILPCLFLLEVAFPSSWHVWQHDWLLCNSVPAVCLVGFRWIVTKRWCSVLFDDSCEKGGAVCSLSVASTFSLHKEQA